MGQERLGPSYFFIPLVLGPLNSLVWSVPSLRYTRGLGWRMHCGAEVTESSTNKQQHLSHSLSPPNLGPNTRKSAHHQLEKVGHEEGLWRPEIVQQRGREGSFRFDASKS